MFQCLNWPLISCLHLLMSPFWLVTMQFALVCFILSKMLPVYPPGWTNPPRKMLPIWRDSSCSYLVHIPKHPSASWWWFLVMNRFPPRSQLVRYIYCTINPSLNLLSLTNLGHKFWCTTLINSHIIMCAGWTCLSVKLNWIIYIYKSKWIYTHIYIKQTYAYIYIYTHINIYIYVELCMYIRVYIYKHR